MSCHSRFTAALTAGLVLLSVASVRGQSYPPAVGTRHPDFTLPAIDDGRPISLSDFRGKKVLLVQFASW